MAILEVDKIIITKPDTGIHCSGDLKQTYKVKLPDKVIACITLDKVRIRHYQCENCKKKYIVL